MNRKLLIATTNRGKVREYISLLKEIPFDLVSLTDEGITTVVEETGITFKENAGLKAETIAAESRFLTLADDSGIEVDALGGEPGVMSARYAGDDATDSERVDYLLLKMKNVPEGKRTARFRCVIAIAEPEGETAYFTGECEGIVPLKPAGELGFGYDPILYIPELGKTLAELGPEVKNRISHRAIAAQKARLALLEKYTT
ncbi:MAG: RdgB/HAM1 family non-canonical purine NTP pyrophosphatase [Dehalococcoidales bacterium]|nr:MAG: RdgB/HAM1 family non-canonical purine NTP pyrophosphatase [Dehalococcoidales bacterium]